jgi:hypothetical protein
MRVLLSRSAASFELQLAQFVPPFSKVAPFFPEVDCGDVGRDRELSDPTWNM